MYAANVFPSQHFSSLLLTSSFICCCVSRSIPQCQSVSHSSVLLLCSCSVILSLFLSQFLSLFCHFLLICPPVFCLLLPSFLKLCSPLCISYCLSNVLLLPSGIYNVCTGRKNEVLRQIIFTKRLWRMTVNTTVLSLLLSLIQSGSGLKKTFTKQNRGFGCTFTTFKVVFKNNKQVVTRIP